MSAFTLRELSVEIALIRQHTAFQNIACLVEILSLPLAINLIEDW